MNAVIKNNIIRLYSNCTKSQIKDPLIPIQGTELSRLPFPNQSVIFDYRSALFNKIHAPYRPQNRVNATKFAYRNPTSLVPMLRKSTCKFTMALPFFLSFSCLSFVCFLSLFVCFHFLCVCVSVLFCIVFVLLKLMVLQHILFTKAYNMLRFLIETLRELSVIGLMTTRFQKIFANVLFGCCKKKYNSRSRIEIEKK